MRFQNNKTFLILFFFLVLVALHGQSTLQNAKVLANDGKSQEALELYKTWLASNPESEEYASVLFKAATLLNKTEDIISFLKKYASANRKSLLGAARLAETAGYFEEAQQWYLKSAYYPLEPGNEMLPPYPGDLIKSAALLVEMGRLEEGVNQIKKVLSSTNDIVLIQQASLLAARILAASGKVNEAISNLSSLHKSISPKSAIVPESLLFLFILSRMEKKDSIASETFELLQENYPKSPEYNIALRLREGTKPGDTVVQYPSPFLILDLPEIPYGKKITPMEVENKVIEKESQSPIGIQVGSFTMKENSIHLKQELIKKDISAYISETDLSGKKYYKVIVPIQENQDSQILLDRLKEKGYEGFFVF
jgi:hypothetical protein